MSDNRVKDGPSCRGCGLPNYEGFCPVCRGDHEEAVRNGMWPPGQEEYQEEEEGSKP